MSSNQQLGASSQTRRSVSARSTRSQQNTSSHAGQTQRPSVRAQHAASEAKTNPSTRHAGQAERTTPAAHSTRQRLSSPNKQRRTSAASNSSIKQTQSAAPARRSVRAVQGAEEPTRNTHDALTSHKNTHIQQKQTRNNKLPFALKLGGLIVVALLLVGIIDTIRYWDKAYAGVTVSGVDVTGMTADEIKQTCTDQLTENLYDSSVEVFANEETYARVNGTEFKGQTLEPLSADEARSAQLMWSFNAEEFGAALDLEKIATDALAVGRENGGILARLSALFFDYPVQASLTYSADSFTSLMDEIDASIGVARIDANFVINDGVASPTDGQDGILINREEFTTEVINALFLPNAETGRVVAHAYESPMRISYESATELCEKINAAIADGAILIFDGAGWQTTRTMLGTWIDSEMIQKGNSWELIPVLNTERAKPSIFQAIRNYYSGEDINVSFSVSGDTVTVHTDSSGKVPQVEEGIKSLELALFGGQGSSQASAALAADGAAVQIEIPAVQVAKTMSFDEALNCGVISLIQSYTIEYSVSEASASRNHNIRLAADLINNSICPANGGVWSFHETAGECNEEKGFEPAGSIIDGEYVDSIGGGICCVATTVFNAVFEAGYHVNNRYYHSLYSSNYPEGRDAAVNWPDLDLRWSNNTASDVLVQTSHTNSSVTVMLYGVDPNYRVESVEGDRSDLTDFETKYIVDESLSPTYSYVKSPGVQGHYIEVTRYVYDKNDNLIDTQVFKSRYDPKTEIIYCGTEFEIPEKE